MKKGLYILSKVKKYHGEKIFCSHLIKTKDVLFDVNKLTSGDINKEKFKSSYADFFGGVVDEKFKFNNYDIFQYKQFQHLNYTEIIRKEYYYFIQKKVEYKKIRTMQRICA